MPGEFYVYNSLHPIKAKYKQYVRKYFPYENALSRVFGDLFKCGIWDIMWCELYTWCKCHIILIDTLPKYAQTKLDEYPTLTLCFSPTNSSKNRTTNQQPKLQILPKKGPLQILGQKQLGSQASEHGAAVTTQNPCDLWVVDLQTGRNEGWPIWILMATHAGILILACLKKTYELVV